MYLCKNSLNKIVTDKKIFPIIVSLRFMLGKAPGRAGSTFNHFMTNGFIHHCYFCEPTFSFKDVRGDFEFLFHSFFFDENLLSKQNSPRWDAVYCGVTSGLYCLPISHKKTPGLY